ncbi:MAG: DUF6064 family protein [Desulfobacula sp.]|nr:DUF6064 family protein [Desulfobacula sp.]
MTNTSSNHFIEAFIQMNTQCFPYSIIVPIFFMIGTLLLVFLCFKKPGSSANTMLKVFLALIYFTFGVCLWIYLRPLAQGLASSSAIGNWLISLLFLTDAFWWKKIIFQIPQQKELKVFMFLFMILGMVVYPIIEIFTGMTWPGMIFFGAGCPTNTFVIGLLIGSLPKTNMLIMAIISSIAVIMGSHCAWTGITADWVFFMAGIVGWAMFARYWDKNIR